MPRPTAFADAESMNSHSSPSLPELQMQKPNSVFDSFKPQQYNQLMKLHVQLDCDSAFMSVRSLHEVLRATHR